jgi:xanthosine utilization system XapX-like protein
VLANASISSFRIDYSACASIKDGMTGAVDQRISTFVIPAPGAIALLGIGGIAMRRRRG